MAEEEVKDNKPAMTQEEIDKIKADIADAENKLVSQGTQDVIAKAKEEAKAEALKEVEVQKKLEELEKEKESLVKSKEDQEKASSEELAKLKTKVDELTTSKQSIAGEDPFLKTPGLSKQVDDWSDDKVRQIEEDSARKMFGDSFDTRQ